MQAILDYLANSGEQLDSEIAAATGLSVATVRARATDLHAKGAIMLCRISGYIPPAAPGRKSKAQMPPKSTATID